MQSTNTISKGIEATTVLVYSTTNTISKGY